MVDVSIVIPMKNEAGNAAELISGLVEHCSDVEIEIIVIDDASTDGTADVVLGMAKLNPSIRLLQNSNSGGQSAAVHSGVLVAKAAVVCTLDGDGQNPPLEVPNLYRPLIADTVGKIGLVAGQRADRQDTASKKWASKFANALRGWLLNDGTRDTGCGLKGFRRDVFLSLPYFDHMHRYLPALCKRDGWDIVLVDVSHKERGAGTSNYSNLHRAFVGVYDLIGVAWLIRRRKKASPKEIT